MPDAEKIVDHAHVVGDEDILTFVDRHGLDGLETALHYAYEYYRGETNHHIMAREQDLSPLEAGIILESLRPFVEAEPDYSDTRWPDDKKMPDREADVINDRLDEIKDEDKRYSTEEVANDIGIDLDSDDDDGPSRRVSHNLMDEPHIAGRRIPVRQVRVLIEEGGKDAAAVADRFDLDTADVYHALAYYHDHPQEMRDVGLKRKASRERGRGETLSDGDETEDAAIDVRSADEIARKSGTNLETVEEEIDAMRRRSGDDEE